MKIAALLLLLAFPILAAGQFHLVSTVPAPNAIAVDRQQVLEFTFNESVDPSTIPGCMTVVSQFRGLLSGTFSSQAEVMRFDPAEDFLSGEEIIVTLYPTLQSLTMAPLTVPAAIRFRTETAVPPLVPPVFKYTEIHRATNSIVYPSKAVDFDQDGDIDLVSGSSWLKNNGNGSFSKHLIYPQVSPDAVKVVDLDQDGDLDLVIGSNYLGVTILINDGSMTFTSTNLTGNSVNVYSVDAADMDANGLVDILYSRDGVSTIILYQQPGFVFTPVVISPTRADKILLVDMDKDGDWDIIQQDAPQVRYLENTGGTFQPSVLFTGSVRDIAVEDFEGDGDIDIVSAVDEYLQIHVNDGNNFFTAKEIHTTESMFGSGDLDGDGDIDIIFPDNPGMQMLINDGANNFTPHAMGRDRGFSIYLRSINPADADNDGDLDVFLGADNSQVLLYENAELYQVSFFSPEGNVKSVNLGASDWGDYDNDDDLDLLICGLHNGTPVTVLYSNQDGILSEVTTPFQAVSNGSCDWGDFDLDGDLDVLLMGSTTAGPVTLVYVNVNGTFTLHPTQLPGGVDGRAAWGDFDNDRWLDIVLFANNASGMYQSDGHGNFALRYDLPEIHSEATMDLADYDRDGDLDLAYAGWAGLQLQVIRNDGNWTFSHPTGSFSAVRGGNLNWTDVDNDGDLDLLAAGRDPNVNSLSIYQNNNGVFSSNPNQPSWSISISNQGTLATGDLDNDGSPDGLASTVVDSYDGRLLFLKNNGMGLLAVESTLLPEIITRTISLADYDADGDLDAYAGTLLRNNAPTPNTKPTIPSGIEVDSVYNNDLYFHWNESSDQETASSALTYEVYAGTTPQGQDVLRANANLASGKRTLVREGAIGKAQGRLNNLAGGEYFLGVQAVDAAFEGSPFSTEVQVKVIAINGVNGGCPGYVQGYAAKPSKNYTWEAIGGEILSGQNTDSIGVRWGSLGVGYVTVSDSEGNRSTIEVRIEVKPQPQLTGTVEVCTGEEVYLVNDPLTVHSTWIATGNHTAVNTSGASATIPWQHAGDHKVIVIAQPEHKGCSSYDTLAIKVDKRPEATIFGPLEVCTNWVVRYETISDQAVWSTTHGEILVDSTNYVRVKWHMFPVTGGISVTEVSARAYCTTINAKEVSIFQSPGKPFIRNYGDTLYSTVSPTDYYEWYYEDELIAAGPYYGVITDIPGVYRVVVYDPSGCGAVSDPFYHLVTAVEPRPTPAAASLLVYPNPTQTALTIELANAPPGEYNIRIISPSDQFQKELQVQSTDQGFRYTIDVSGLKPGLYVLTVSNGGLIRAMKFVKL